MRQEGDMYVNTCVTWRNQPNPGTPDLEFVISTPARQARAALAIKKGGEDEEDEEEEEKRKKKKDNASIHII